MSHHHRRSILRCWPLLVFLGCLATAALPSAHAAILSLDWAHLSAAYQSGAANAGTTQSFTVGSNTVSTVFGYQGNITSSAFVLGTPITGTNGTTGNTPSYASGGTTDGELALQIGVSIPDTTTEGIKFTINFSQAVYGATFRLFDVDYSANSFTDQVHDIVGTNGTATTYLPTLTGNAANTVGGASANAASGFANSVTGTGGSPQTYGGGDVTVAFSSTQALTSISFIYGDNRNANLGAVAPTSTTQQLIALSNINWSTVSGAAVPVPANVPEPGMLGATGVGLATMLAVTLRRRR